MTPRSPTSAPPTQEMKVRFGQNLARARRRAGLSQEELGFLAGLHRTETGLLERGERTARIDTAVKLSGALEIPVQALLEGIAWRPPPVTSGGFDISADGAEPKGGSDA
jgi:transcriptional regulator with XRE-family HTH domain